MPEALRPMSTGELLDRTFSLYRKHFSVNPRFALGQGEKTVPVFTGYFARHPYSKEAKDEYAKLK